MENLTVEKSSVLAAYKAGSADQKEMLEHLGDAGCSEGNLAGYEGLATPLTLVIEENA